MNLPNCNDGLSSCMSIIDRNDNRKSDFYGTVSSNDIVDV